MYFRNKFNLEIQRIIRNMDEVGAWSHVNNFSRDLWRIETVDKKTIKIIPLFMTVQLTSSNKEDKVYDNSIVVAENNGTTIIDTRGASK